MPVTGDLDAMIKMFFPMWQEQHAAWLESQQPSAGHPDGGVGIDWPRDAEAQREAEAKKLAAIKEADDKRSAEIEATHQAVLEEVGLLPSTDGVDAPSPDNTPPLGPSCRRHRKIQAGPAMSRSRPVRVLGRRLSARAHRCRPRRRRPSTSPAAAAAQPSGASAIAPATAPSDLTSRLWYAVDEAAIPCRQCLMPQVCAEWWPFCQLHHFPLG